MNKCKQCNAEFEPKRQKQLYCSPNCRKEGWRSVAEKPGEASQIEASHEASQVPEGVTVETTDIPQKISTRQGFEEMDHMQKTRVVYLMQMCAISKEEAVDIVNENDHE